MNELIIKLPLPSAKLSPNARVHWRTKAPITKAHRRAAAMVAQAATKGMGAVSIESYHLLFVWPDKRRRDKDGALSRCKAYLDGISDAIKQDDSEWGFTGVTFAEPDKDNPRVEIILTLCDS